MALPGVADVENQLLAFLSSLAYSSWSIREDPFS